MASYQGNKQITSGHKKAVAEHFSRQSEYWRIVYRHDQKRIDSFMNIHMRNRRAAVLQFIDEYAQNRSLRILETGCGAGGIMVEVLKRGHEVIGTDISEDMLRTAGETSESYSGKSAFIQGDIEGMPFSDNSFDVVISVGVLQYLQNDKNAVAEMSRVLKTGGIIILTLPNMLRINTLLDPYYYLNRGVKYILYQTFMDKNKVMSEDFHHNNTFRNRRYVYGQLTGLFKIHRLSKVDSVGIGFGPMTFWRRELFPVTISIKISDFFEKIARKKMLSTIAFFANRWVVCLKKEHADNSKTDY